MVDFHEMQNGNPHINWDPMGGIIREDVTQRHPLQGQTRNTHGGYSFEIDDVIHLKRYLILGSTRPEYNSRQATDVSNALPFVNDMIRAGDGRTVIDTILELNKDARISREEHFLVVLRDCIMYKGEAWYDEENKITIQRKAFDSISSICNIPTKLFRLIELCYPGYQNDWTPSEAGNLSKTQEKKRRRAVAKAEANKEHVKKMATETCEIVDEEEPPKKKKKKKKSKSKKKKEKSVNAKKFKRSSSWGRARMRGISSFYTDEIKNANRLLLLVTKYKSRHNWDHKQVIGYCHPKMTGDEAAAKNIVMKYATRGFDGVKKYYEETIRDAPSSSVLYHIKVLEEVKRLQPEKPEDVARLLELMKKFVKREVPLEFSSYTVEGSKPTENVDNKRSPFQLTREHLPNGFLKLKAVSLFLYLLYYSYYFIKALYL